MFQLTEFWKHYLPQFQAWLAQWLPRGIATPLGAILSATVIFAGTCGVRLLAIPYLLWGDLRKRDALLVGWLGAFFVASAAMGLLMELNSYGELYLFLMMRLPMAVLAAAFFVSAARQLRFWWSEPHEVRAAARWLGRFAMGGVAVVLIGAFAVQISLWVTRNRAGFVQWLSTPVDVKPESAMQQLQEALLWVRNHTEPSAVLVANAFTPENMKKDHWGALDRTLMGVHFYYSAFSERRLWFEGPNYALDTTRLRLRASLASNFFYRGRPLAASLVSPGACYVLIDHSLNDGAGVAASAGQRVFANARMEIYRLAEPMTEERGVAVDEGAH